VFQVHRVDAEGKVVVARKPRRKQVLAFFAKLVPCLVGMEACGSAHYWGREIAKLGHTVKLMPPKYVKAYVKRGKTDAIDAAAIREAVTRPSMSFVPVKGIEQQGLSMLHSARSQLIGQRTQLMNAVRGHLSEFGIIAARGLLGLAELVAIVRDESDHRLPVTARAALIVLVRQIEMVSTEIAPSWSKGASTRSAIALRNIERRARPVDKAAYDAREQEEHTRKASRVAVVLMA
jgi:transposase